MRFLVMYNYKTDILSGNSATRITTDKLDVNKFKEELMKKYGYTEVVVTRFVRIDEEVVGTKADIEIEREKKEAAKSPPAPLAPSETPKKTRSRRKKVVVASE